MNSTIVESEETEVAAGEELYAASPLDDADEWTYRGCRRIFVLLLVGFSWPLLKSSLLFGQTVWVWPWNLAGLGGGAEARAATAIMGGGDLMFVWTMIPLVAAVLVFSQRNMANIATRSLMMAATALVALLLFQVVFVNDAQVFGLLFIVPHRGFQLCVLTCVIAAALIAVGNRLRKTFSIHVTPRILSCVGGLTIWVLVLTPFLDGSPLIATLFKLGSWKSEWSSNVVLLMVLAYASLGVTSGMKTLTSDALSGSLSLLARLTLCLFPMACLIAQNNMNNGFVAYVLEGGGGVQHNVMSALKCFSIYYAFLLLFATGLAGWLLTRLWRDSSPVVPE